MNATFFEIIILIEYLKNINSVDSFMKNELTIVIPTYNRKTRLLSTLQSIFLQDTKTIEKVIVIDNNSNYDVQEVLNLFENDKLVLVKNPFNTGMIGNLTNSYLYCKTKWMWLLSDDDDVHVNSIEKINNYIKISADVSSVRFVDIYTIQHEIKPMFDVNCIESFIDYYDKVGKKGELMFMSNAIYNLDILNPFFRYSYTFSYTYIPHLVLTLFALNKGNKVRIVDDKIVTFKDSESGSGWDALEVYLGISTFSHLPLELNKYYKRKLLSLFTSMNYKQLFFVVLKNYSDYNILRYRLINKNLWSNSCSFSDKLQIYLRIFILKNKWLTQIIFNNRIQ